MLTSMETQEANNAPGLRELDWQARQQIVGALEGYVDRVAMLLGDNENFDRRYMERRVANVLDDVNDDLRQHIADAVTKAMVRQ